MSTQPLKLLLLGTLKRRFGCFLFFFLIIVVLLSVLCLTFCDPMNCSTPGFLSFTISWILLKLMSTELVMPSNHLIPASLFSFCLHSFPASGSFSVSWLFASGSLSMELQLQHQSFQWIFKKNNFLYIWLCWVFVAAGLLSRYGAQASHCHGFSCYGARVLEHGLNRCSAWA